MVENCDIVFIDIDGEFMIVRCLETGNERRVDLAGVDIV